MKKNFVLKGAMPESWDFAGFFFCLSKLMLLHLKLIRQIILKILRKQFQGQLTVPSYKWTLLHNMYMEEKYFKQKYNR